jgi:hypothetical protein
MPTFHYRYPSRANKHFSRILAPSRRLPLPPLKLKNELLPSSGYATRSRTTSHQTPGLRSWHPRFSPTCAASTPSRPPRPAPSPAADPAETDLHRLARVVALFMPGCSPRRHHSAPTSDCARYAGHISFPERRHQHLAAAGCPGRTPCYLGPATVRRISTTTAPAGRPPHHHAEAEVDDARRIVRGLPDHVYTALDACAHLPPAQRSKLQDACKKSSSGALFDVATWAPFGHQLQLSLTENAHFISEPGGSKFV